MKKRVYRASSSSSSDDELAANRCKDNKIIMSGYIPVMCHVSLT